MFFARISYPISTSIFEWELSGMSTSPFNMAVVKIRINVVFSSDVTFGLTKHFRSIHVGRMRYMSDKSHLHQFSNSRPRRLVAELPLTHQRKLPRIYEIAFEFLCSAQMFSTVSA